MFDRLELPLMCAPVRMEFPARWHWAETGAGWG